MLNKRGFAITGVMYILLLLFVVIIFGMFVVLGSRKIIIDNYRIKIQEKIDVAPAIVDYVSEGLVVWYDAITNVDRINQLLSSEDEFYDLSDNLNIGNLIAFEDGWYDNYLEFDGVDDYINTGIAANNFGPSDDYSLEIFFRIKEVTAVTDSSSLLLGAFNGEGFGIVWETYDEDDSKYFLRVGGRDATGESFTDNYEVTDFLGKQNVTMVYSNLYGEIRFYVNGELIATSASLTGDFTEALGSIVIGNNAIHDIALTGGFSNMELYSIRIYDRAISLSEIIRNYAIDRSRY